MDGDVFVGFFLYLFLFVCINEWVRIDYDVVMVYISGYYMFFIFVMYSRIVCKYDY